MLIEWKQNIFNKRKKTCAPKQSGYYLQAYKKSSEAYNISQI